MLSQTFNVEVLNYIPESRFYTIVKHFASVRVRYKIPPDVRMSVWCPRRVHPWVNRIARIIRGWGWSTMAARPQEAPPFSVPCSRRHFTLITMRLAPSSLPQPLESLTPLGLPSFLPPRRPCRSTSPAPPRLILFSSSPSEALTHNRLDQHNPCLPVTVLNAVVRPAR